MNNIKIIKKLLKELKFVIASHFYVKNKIYISVVEVKFHREWLKCVSLS